MKPYGFSRDSKGAPSISLSNSSWSRLFASWIFPQRPLGPPCPRRRLRGPVLRIGHERETGHRIRSGLLDHRLRVVQSEPPLTPPRRIRRLPPLVELEVLPVGP